MKQIIFTLAFIYCVFCAGPAYNVEDREEENGPCDTGLTFADENLSTSSCVDRDLYDVIHGYFDKCCYIRLRAYGRMIHGCIGLNREQFMDVPQTIENMENGKSTHFYNKGLQNTKIYELNCNSSYLQIFALSFALISLLF